MREFPPDIYEEVERLVDTVPLSYYDAWSQVMAGLPGIEWPTTQEGINRLGKALCLAELGVKNQ